MRFVIWQHMKLHISLILRISEIDLATTEYFMSDAFEKKIFFIFF